MYTSNYNVLYIHGTPRHEYRCGDIFLLTKHSYNMCSYRIRKFDSLVIENITFCFGILCLHFNFNEWANNEPPVPCSEIRKIENNHSTFNHIF
jgi:hypothetical protein